MTAMSTPEAADRSDWREAGRGWGAQATDWAYLFEPYARPANDLLLDRLGVGAGAPAVHGGLRGGDQ